MVNTLIHLSARSKILQIYSGAYRQSQIKSSLQDFRDQEIYFLFYKETVVDTEYRFGSFRDVYSETIVIEANFNSDIDYPLMKFNGFFFLFKGRMFRWFNYEILAKVLLEIYLDHLEKNH